MLAMFPRSVRNLSELKVRKNSMNFNVRLSFSKKLVGYVG